MGRTIGVAAEIKARLVLDQFNFFIDTLGSRGLRGKVVVEIGPGDAIPLAPLFLAAGAKSYVAVDRFLGEVHGAEACRLYRAIVEILPERLSGGLHALCRAAGCSSVEELLRRPDQVRLHRSPIEQPDDSIRGQADYVVSFNVCEHLADLPRAFRGMRSLLAPEGLMIHRVDYGPHDVWVARYANPLAFLTVPRVIWRWMTSNRGCPNRVRHAQLMAMVGALGFECTARIGRRASDVAVSEARAHLSSEFRSLSDDEIAVLDAEVICSLRNGHLHQSGRPAAIAGVTA